jgi:hypothetical protein
MQQKKYLVVKLDSVKKADLGRDFYLNSDYYVPIRLTIFDPNDSSIKKYLFCPMVSVSYNNDYNKERTSKFRNNYIINLTKHEEIFFDVTNGILKKQPPITAFKEELSEIFKDKLLVTYNGVSFDGYILNKIFDNKLFITDIRLFDERKELINYDSDGLIDYYFGVNNKPETKDLVENYKKLRLEDKNDVLREKQLKLYNIGDELTYYRIAILTEPEKKICDIPVIIFLKFESNNLEGLQFRYLKKYSVKSRTPDENISLINEIYQKQKAENNVSDAQHYKKVKNSLIDSDNKLFINESEELCFNFGKYKGVSICEVYNTDKNYINYITGKIKNTIFFHHKLDFREKVIKEIEEKCLTVKQ